MFEKYVLIEIVLTEASEGRGMFNQVSPERADTPVNVITFPPPEESANVELFLPADETVFVPQIFATSLNVTVNLLV